MILKVNERLTAIDAPSSTSIDLKSKKESGEPRQLTSSKSSQRRLRTETLNQPNLNAIQPGCAVKCAAPQLLSLGLPDPLIIAMMILLASRLEEILSSVQDHKLEPLKEALAEHKKAIMTLQQEIAKNNALIEKLQMDAQSSKEARVSLEKALQEQQKLLADLQEKVGTHDLLIAQLQDGIIQNKDLSRMLQDAIAENKRMIECLQKDISEIHELQDILVKYGNNADGLPALHAAIKRGDKRAVEVLIKHGADVNSKQGVSADHRAGITALCKAVIENQLEIAALLLDNGANINDFGESVNSTIKTTAIHFAAELGNPEIIKLLVERGADINKSKIIESYDPCNPNRRERLESPLYIAAQSGNLEAVVMLVNLGAIINASCEDKNNPMCNPLSPLDVAARDLKYSDNPHNLDLIRFLVEHGARRNHPGGGPVNCPVIKGYLESVSRY